LGDAANGLGKSFGCTLQDKLKKKKKKKEDGRSKPAMDNLFHFFFLLHACWNGGNHNIY